MGQAGEMETRLVLPLPQEALFNDEGGRWGQWRKVGLNSIVVGYTRRVRVRA